MGKKSGSGSAMNNPDHISESLETISRVKIPKFIDADPGWKKFRIRDKHPGSATVRLAIMKSKYKGKIFSGIRTHL